MNGGDANVCERQCRLSPWGSAREAQPNESSPGADQGKREWWERCNGVMLVSGVCGDSLPVASSLLHGRAVCCRYRSNSSCPWLETE